MQSTKEIKDIKWRPHSGQIPVMESLSKARYINLVTSNRWGKTFLERRIAHFWAAKLGNKRNCGVFVGQDFKAIKRNFVNWLLIEWGAYVKDYNKQDHIIELITGHLIYVYTEESIKSIEGASDMAYAIIDEASLLDEGVLEALDTRAIDLRAPIFTASTALPGPGLEWLEEQYNRGLNPKYCGDDVNYYNRVASHTGTIWDNAVSNGGHLSDAEIKNYIDRRTQKELIYRVYGGFPSIGEHVFNYEDMNPSKCGYQLHELEKYQFQNYMLIDTASGQTEKEQGDDTAIVIVGIAPQYGIFVLECIADKFSVSEIMNIIIGKARQYGIWSIGVEHLAAQTNYFEDALYKSMQIRDAFRLVKIKRHGGNDAKPARHGRLEPYLVSGRLKFPVDSYGNFIMGCDKLISQMKATPYTKKTHDDCIDALADIVAPEMGIVAGFEKQFVRPEDVGVKMPLLSSEQVMRIRNPGQNPEDDLTDYLLEVAGIARN